MGAIPGPRCVAAVLFVFTCVLAILSTAAAQTANVTLNGVVRDPSGLPIAGATVTASNTQTGIQRRETSDDGGRYSILSLPPGFYDISVAHEGFATTVRKNQEFLVGTTITTDFALQVSSLSQTVEVQGDAPIMETTQSTVERILQTQEVDTLPVLNRSFAQLATMTPGVQSQGTSYGGTGSVTSAAVTIGNAPTYQTGYIVDGVTNETGNQGGQYVNLSQDWVQEFSVLTLQFPAEYGMASGGVVNSVMRSGTNKLHGRGYGFVQNAVLNSNPEFYKGATKAPFDSERIGGMAGGPIKHDRLFFFAGYEHFHNYQTNTIGTTGASGLFASTAQPLNTPAAQIVPWLIYGPQTTAPTVNISDLAMVKLDYTLNERNSFNIRSNLDYESVTNNGFGGAGTFGSATNGWAPNYAEAASWTRMFSPNTLNELRFGYFAKGTRNETNYCLAKGFYTGVTLNSDPYNYVATASLGGPTPFGNPAGVFATVNYNGVNTGGQCGGVLNADVSGVLTETLTRTRGNHEIKVGGQLRKYYIYSNSAHNQTDGTYTFGATPGPFNPNTAIAQNLTAAGFKAASALAPTSYVVQFPNPPSLTSWIFHSYAFGGFAQDSWKVTRNLTLNLGVRYDFSNTNSALATNSFPALADVLPGSKGFIKPGFHTINNDPFDIGPRIGFAWMPFHGSKNTVVRGGFGVFYDQNDTASVAVYMSGNSWAPTGYSFAANVATRNPYCVGNSSCANGVPPQFELAVLEVLSSALANYTLPQFPVSTAPCGVANSCTVAVGPNTYHIPALSVAANPQGNLLDIAPTYKVPGTMQSTIGVQHQVTNSLNVAADFVYRYGFNGIVSVNNNIALVGTGATATYTTINPAYTTGYQLQAAATQVSKDLDVQASYRDRRGDSARVAYQFGYSNDNSVTSFSISAHNALTTNPFDLQTDYGPSSLDARQILNVSGNVNMYWGIQLAPILSFTSALPYTATSTLQGPGSSASCPSYYTKCYPALNGATYSRDSLRGDHFISLNARLLKVVRIRESLAFTAFLEGYNITNRHNLGTNFFTNVDAANFQTPNGTSLPLRQLQVGARFDF